MDFILNGAATGPVASKLVASNMDVGVLRPYIDTDGKACITTNAGGEPKVQVVSNAEATLRKNEWQELDTAVRMTAKKRLRGFDDLRSAGLLYNVGGGMAKTVLESQRMSDMTPAKTSMDALQQGESDRVEFDLVGIPLPVTFKEFVIPARQVLASRNSGSPLDTLQAEEATRKVADAIEDRTFGNDTAYQYGGYTAYGYRTFPSRLTASLTLPTDVGWTPSLLVTEILAMRQQLINNKHYGPYALYFSSEWAKYLDEDYSEAKGDNTLRQRIAAINNISSVRDADYLSNNEVIMVEQNTDTVRAVIGLDFTTVQWESRGGLALHFLIMAIMMVQLRSDMFGNTGICHGTAS